jgi:hypothetical protein
MKFSVTKLLVVLGLALVSTECQSQTINVNKDAKLDATNNFKPVKRVQLKDHFCSLTEV